MRKLMVLFAVLVLMVGSTIPVFASIDPLVESGCAAQDSQSDNSSSPPTAGDNQRPPGQTPGDGIGAGGDLAAINNSIGNSKGHSTSGDGTNNCTNAGDDWPLTAVDQQERSRAEEGKQASACFPSFSYRFPIASARPAFNG